MNLWRRLENRGREECGLDETWHLYAVNLSNTENLAEVKFAQKDGDKYLVVGGVVGEIKYMDLR